MTALIPNLSLSSSSAHRTMQVSQAGEAATGHWADGRGLLSAHSHRQRLAERKPQLSESVPSPSWSQHRRKLTGCAVTHEKTRLPAFT